MLSDVRKFGVVGESAVVSRVFWFFMFGFWMMWKIENRENERLGEIERD